MPDLTMVVYTVVKLSGGIPALSGRVRKYRDAEVHIKTSSVFDKSSRQLAGETCISWMYNLALPEYPPCL